MTQLNSESAIQQRHNGELQAELAIARSALQDSKERCQRLFDANWRLRSRVEFMSWTLIAAAIVLTVSVIYPVK